MRNAKNLVESASYYNSFLERIGIGTQSSIFRVDACDEYFNMQVIDAKIQTVAAQIFKSEFNMSLCNFESLLETCINKDIRTSASWHFKYRSIDGRRNNLKNPEWGACKSILLK